MHNGIDLVGGDSRSDYRGTDSEYFGGSGSGPAHAFDHFRALDSVLGTSSYLPSLGVLRAGNFRRNGSPWADGARL
jgi:hypothetical protein